MLPCALNMRARITRPSKRRNRRLKAWLPIGYHTRHWIRQKTKKLIGHVPGHPVAYRDCRWLGAFTLPTLRPLPLEGLTNPIYNTSYTYMTLDKLPD